MEASVRSEDEAMTLCSPIIQEGVAMIFLMGKIIRTDATESRLAAAQRYHHTRHYFLLVLSTDRDERARNQLQDKIEQSAAVELTALVLDLVLFNSWLKEGHSFATLIQQKAMPLYDAGLHTLEEGTAREEHAKAGTRQQTLQHGRTNTEAFLAGAELFALRGQSRMAAFMLHQAAEQALRALLIHHAGLHIVTHNLDKLMRYGLLFCAGLYPVWEGMKGEALRLLQKAYIDARYSRDYTISAGMVKELTQKVRGLQALLEKGFTILTD